MMIPSSFCKRYNMNMKHFLLGATFALAAPFAASAATVSSGFNYDIEVLTSGNSVSVDYDVADGTTWTIGDISFTANGAWADITSVSVTVSSTGETYTVWTKGQGNTATLLATGFTTSDDFTVTYTYAAGSTGTVLATATFTATQVLDTVPLPAAGLLLGSALAGLGIAKRRKKS